MLLWNNAWNNAGDVDVGDNAGNAAGSNAGHKKWITFWAPQVLPDCSKMGPKIDPQMVIILRPILVTLGAEP